MKRRCSILLLLAGLMLMVACHSPRREARQMLRRAEQLAAILPDSTARLIDSVLRMPMYFNERQRMDMALLQGEAIFRDAPLDDDSFEDSAFRVATSPELERAADFFAKKKQYAKAAHAALYSGYVQQHYNEKEASMRSFKAAEQYGQLSGDSLTMARAEYRIGKLLYYEGRKQEALSSFSISLNHIGNRTADKAAIENGKGVSHIMLNQFDSAEMCFRQSCLYAEKGHSIIAKRKALNNFAVLYRIQGKYEQAISSLKQMEESDLAEQESALLYLNLVKTYATWGKMDSVALYYQCLERALEVTNVKEETKVSAYEALFRFAESQGLYTMALKYYEKHKDALYEVMHQHQEQSIFRIQKQYDYEFLKNSMNQKLMRRHRVTIIVSVVAIMGLFAFAYSQIRLARMRKREAEANANLFHFMQQNKALIEKNAANKKEILDTTQQLSDMLETRLSVMQQLDYCLKTPKDKIALKDLEREVFGSSDHWDAIKDVLDTLYPGLWESLKLKYPEMDEMELRVCMLSRLKLSRLAESTLLGISTSVLDKLRTKVRKMMTKGEYSDDSPQKFG